MTDTPLITEIDDTGAGWLIVNRPEVHNAFDDALIAQLTEALRDMEGRPQVRAVVLAAEGKNFSAGADLNWMRRTADYAFDDNVDDALGLAGLMRTLDRLAKPTLALVQGAAIGGGVGLVAAADIAIAADDATFCLAEVKLGLTPAVIAPCVVAAMGARQARRYFLTAERFGATDALDMGLVHAVVPADQLRATARRMLGLLAGNGPRALADAKDLIFAVGERAADEAMMRDVAERTARSRASDEGREGMAAYLEKRKPAWTRE